MGMHDQSATSPLPPLATNARSEASADALVRPYVLFTERGTGRHRARPRRRLVIDPRFVLGVPR